jgi:hypothetical protein
LFDFPPYSPDLAQNYYHPFTYLKHWLRSQRFSNKELMEDVKTWLSSQATDIFDFFPDTTNAVTTFRSSLSMYVFFVYNIFSRCFFR